MLPRHDGRRPDELRPVSIEPGYLAHAEGSAMVRFGDTWVLCAVSMEDRVPQFLRGSGGGWVTAEYGMLPRATNTRGDREAVRGRQSGRSQEIQRLIGRALRSVTNLDAARRAQLHRRLRRDPGRRRHAHRVDHGRVRRAGAGAAAARRDAASSRRSR